MLLLAAKSLACKHFISSYRATLRNTHRLRRLQCQAKTTSSRKTTGSNSSDSARAGQSTVSNTASDEAPRPCISSTKRPAVVQDKSFQERVEALVSFLTPKQEGDAGDLFMMSLSMAVLVYMSMQLYRLYVYAYFTMDHYQNVIDMMT